MEAAVDHCTCKWSTHLSAPSKRTVSIKITLASGPHISVHPSSGPCTSMEHVQVGHAFQCTTQVDRAHQYNTCKWTTDLSTPNKWTMRIHATRASGSRMHLSAPIKWTVRINTTRHGSQYTKRVDRVHQYKGITHLSAPIEWTVRINTTRVSGPRISVHQASGSCVSRQCTPHDEMIAR